MSIDVINFKNVNKFFNHEKILDQVNLTIKAGERIVICGPSGSGKSTLIRCINGLESIDSGSLKVHGIDLFQNNKESNQIQKLRQRIGMVFQQLNLFPHLTILENCILAPIKIKHMQKSNAKQLAIKYLKRVGIAQKIDEYPHQLSGGQQQRAAIARALCMSPDILLFDEPTSALDPEMVKEVLDVIGELVVLGITMIFVTHEMSFAKKIADRLCFVCDGKILEVNTSDQFFTNPQHPRLKKFLSQVNQH